MALTLQFRALLLAVILAVPSGADEGIWLFSQFPKDQVKQKYNLEIPGRFLDDLRLASVRIAGGAGAFVSPDGLLVTNHHLVADCIATVSKLDGFYAATRAAELPCPGLEAGVLLETEDVTKAVKDAAPATAKAAEALSLRNAAGGRLEAECAAKTGNACHVVRLFGGERYELYHYKRYADVRLVFAPELAIADFGGDADNLTYPRYDLDVVFLRAYENGKPAVIAHFLKWNPEGPKDGEPVFVSGNPASTSRLATPAQLNFYRDTALPLTLARLQTRIEALRAFASQSPEKERAAHATLSSFAGLYKASAGRLIGLRDTRLMARKQNLERRLRKAVENDPKLGAAASKVWDDIALAYRTWAPNEKLYEVFERPAAQGSVLFAIARGLVRRAPVESPAPIDDGVETVLLTQYLEDIKALGDKEAPVKNLLGGRTPQQVAEECVRSTKLKDPAERKRLAADHNAVEKSEDPMLRIARVVDEPARRILKKHEEAIESLEASALERIAQYRFRTMGAGEYPDATSTPRVSFGAVKGYKDKTEAGVPFATTFGGLLHRIVKTGPYVLPPRWAEARERLDLVISMNFASTCDTAGGNPGSPTVNARGELVGVVFDNNLEAIPQTYLYSDEQARAVHVATPGVTEALRKVYRANELLQELLGPSNALKASAASPAAARSPE